MRTKEKVFFSRLMKLSAVCFAALAASPVTFARAESASPVHAFIESHYPETLGIIPVLVLLMLLAFIVQIDHYIRNDLKKTMRVIIAVVFSLVVQNYVDYRVTIDEPQWLLRTLASIYGYSVRPVILLLFLQIIAPRKRFHWGWALAGVNTAIQVTALFAPISFWIDAKNHFQRGPLGKVCLYVSAILLLYWFVMTIRMIEPHKRKETWVPVIVAALIAGSVVMDYNVGNIPQPISYLTIAVTISCMAYYIWLHLQFVREHEEALKAGQRVQLTISQIKPHFLYNTLNSISALCDEDPRQVKPAIEKFAHYLRGNMASIDQKGPIPFTQELDHTRSYLDIEQMRFEDALQVCYDIQCTDFNIPALTLEPLVENAVRHGVRKNKDGRGTVTIFTRDKDDCVQVIVTDDGPGFDPEQISEDGKPHVGIANVRERVTNLCGGTLEIQTEPGKGTTAILTLPKKQEAPKC